MPTSWRKLAVAGIAGVATTLAFASPALACHPVFEGSPAAECLTDTTAKVTWTVSPEEFEEQNLVSAEFTIDGKAATGTSPMKPNERLVKNSKFTLTVPRTAKQAALKVTVEKTDKTASGDKTMPIDLSTIDWTKCPKVESPTPSKSASSGAASLPVTGASTGLIAGFAVVLLAAGIALFLVSRRRRVNFTTS